MGTKLDKTILVVEDERPLQAAIKLKLEAAGFGVVTTRSVEQAMSYLDDLSKVDAIWLDHYLLGKEDGLDLVTTLKSDGAKFKNIPIYVVSNTASADKVQSYLKLGITKYYVKAEHRLDRIIREMSSSLEQLSS